MKEGERIDQLPGFINPFESSPYFLPFIDRVQGLLQTYTPDSARDFMESFTGCLFEELAFVGLLPNVSSHDRLLSPQETIDYFSLLYPDMSLRQIRLQVTLAQAYVPDGLLFGKDGKVKKILEYSAQGKDNELVKYMQRKVGLVNNLRHRHPEIFHGAEVVVMFPQDVHRSVLHEGKKPEGVILQPVPITTHHVHQYAKQLARHHFHEALHPHAPHG